MKSNFIVGQVIAADIINNATYSNKKPITNVVSNETILVVNNNWIYYYSAYW